MILRAIDHGDEFNPDQKSNYGRIVRIFIDILLGEEGWTPRTYMRDPSPCFPEG